MRRYNISKQDIKSQRASGHASDQRPWLGVPTMHGALHVFAGGARRGA